MLRKKQTEMNEVHGRCEPWLAGRQESFQDSRVSALTSEGQVGAIPLELQGMDTAYSLFDKN